LGLEESLPHPTRKAASRGMKTNRRIGGVRAP
jgi:hypothetical protein